MNFLSLLAYSKRLGFLLCGSGLIKMLPSERQVVIFFNLNGRLKSLSSCTALNRFLWWRTLPVTTLLPVYFPKTIEELNITFRGLGWEALGDISGPTAVTLRYKPEN